MSISINQALKLEALYYNSLPIKKNVITKHLILLTMTINTGEQISFLAQKSANERKNVYLETILKWTKTYDYDIGIIENSGYDFPELRDKKSIYYSPKIKIVTLDTNKLCKELKQLLDNTSSKGIHELISINYFINNQNLEEYSHIIKITGRYFIPNFDKLVIENINNHLAIIQNNPNRCEIVGCSTKLVKYIFPLFILHEHVETEFKNRIRLLPKDKVLQLPIIPIQRTKRGCGSYFSSL